MLAADIVEIDVDPLRRRLHQLLARSARPCSRSPRRRRARAPRRICRRRRPSRSRSCPSPWRSGPPPSRPRPAAAETKTMSPSFACADPQQAEIGGAAGQAEIAEPLMILDRQRRHLVELLRRPGRALAPAQHVEDGLATLRNGASGSRPPCRPRRPASARRPGRAGRSSSRRSSARACRDRPTATCSRPGPSRPGARPSGASFSSKLSMVGMPCGRDFRCQARVVLLIAVSSSPQRRLEPRRVMNAAPFTPGSQPSLG